MSMEKIMINSDTIKKKVLQKGADLCGIAPISRFDEAPKGFHPSDIFPDCHSIVVFAARFPLSTLQAVSNSPYTLVRNKMVQRLDQISFEISYELEKENVISIPIPSSDPYDFWDQEQNHGRGILSLKHSAELAGLGRIGKNTLLINEQFGNMIWLGAILVDIELKSDPIVTTDICKKCKVCLVSCPQKALTGKTIIQKLCREKSTSCTDGGGWVLSCNICRKICPHHNGIKSKRRKRSQISPNE